MRGVAKIFTSGHSKGGFDRTPLATGMEVGHSVTYQLSSLLNSTPLKFFPNLIQIN